MSNTLIVIDSFKKYQILAFCCALATVVTGYKVLVVVPINGKSHWLYMESFIKEFLHRGHQVTCITSFKLNGPKIDNYTEILIDPPLEMQRISKCIFVAHGSF